MPKNILSVNETELKTIPLPTHGGRYATVGHGYIIDQVLEELKANNFEIKESRYISNINGQVAQGVYHLNYNTDTELGLMFAWGNSYDKSMRFRCAIGAYVFVCGNGIIAGDMSNYGRKHVGDAKDEVTDHIKSQIKLASKYYNQLVADKNIMKDITLTEKNIALFLGTLFITDEVITSSQMILIKDQLKNPAHNYGTPSDSLWTIYNHITYALKKSHPKAWMEAQKNLHKVTKSMFFPALAATLVDPNQLNIEDAIETELSIEDQIKEDEVAVAEVCDQTPEETESDELTLDEYPHKENEVEESVVEVAEVVEEEVQQKCTCGRTEDLIGLCDGTHNKPITDETGLLLMEDEAILDEQEAVEEDMESAVFNADPRSVEEAPESEEIIAHVESDLEYAERVAAIDEVPEPEPEEEPEEDILEDANGHGDVIENGSDWDIDKAKEVEHPQQIEDDVASLIDTPSVAEDLVSEKLEQKDFAEEEVNFLDDSNKDEQIADLTKDLKETPISVETPQENSGEESLFEF